MAASPAAAPGGRALSIDRGAVTAMASPDYLPGDPRPPPRQTGLPLKHPLPLSSSRGCFARRGWLFIPTLGAFLRQPFCSSSIYPSPGLFSCSPHALLFGLPGVAGREIGALGSGFNIFDCAEVDCAEGLGHRQEVALYGTLEHEAGARGFMATQWAQVRGRREAYPRNPPANASLASLEKQLGGGS